MRPPCRAARLGLGSAELDSSEDVSADAVILMWGGMYCVFLLFLGINTSSSDHSPSASPNGLIPLRSMTGASGVNVDAYGRWRSMPSADGQVSLSERRVELRTSSDAALSARQSSAGLPQKHTW